MLLASLGFQALATTSSGSAATLGELDGAIGRERALGAQPLPRAQPATADLLGQRVPDLLGSPGSASSGGDDLPEPPRALRDGRLGHAESGSLAAMASGDSGSTWPPSTTIVWPVM